MRYQSVTIGLLTLLFLCLVGTMVGTLPARADTPITVSTTDDVLSDDGLCSLREAVRAANLDQASGAMPGECPAGNGADTIILPAGTYTLTLPGANEDAALTGDLDITSTVTINGAGAASTIIDGGGIDRVLHVIRVSPQPVITATISHVTVRNGNAGGNVGGGLYNTQCVLTVVDSVVTNNRAVAGGGIANFGGSAVLNLTTSTVSANTTSPGAGGGIWNNTGTINITRSTLTDNRAESSGGGISNLGGIINVNNSTLSSNAANYDGGAISTNNVVDLSSVTITSNTADDNNNGIGDGGGIFNVSVAQINLRNTLLVENTDRGGQAPDCWGPLTSQGYNLLGTLTGCTLSLTTGDITTTAAMLGPLQDNGGATFTHALLPGSPAIDAGNPATPGSGGNACDTTDQRSYIRPADGDGNGSAICDIGAYEFGAVPEYLAFLPLITKSP